MANYTGYGTDPNFIYSFRGVGPYAGLGLTASEAGFQQLRQSLAYRQAGMEGKQRMERAVGMGLPANTDLNKVQKVGIDPFGFGTIYAAPRPQPWGTWGPLNAGDVSGTGPFRNSVWREEQKQAAAIQRAATTRNQQSESEPAPEGYIRNRFGYLEKDYSKEGYKKNQYGYWVKDPESKKSEKPKSTPSSQQTPAMPPQDESWRFSLLGGAPTLNFPFANY